MKRTSSVACLAGVMFAITLTACAENTTTTEEKKERVYAALPNPDPMSGDWADENTSSPVAQVIALGDDQYRIQILRAFDTREEPLLVLEGKRSNGEVKAQNNRGSVSLTPKRLEGELRGEDVTSFTLHHLVRMSPTYDQKPPEGATVLFDGSSLDRWRKHNGQPAGWKLVENKAMEVVPKAGSIKSVDELPDARIHLEFRSPFMPDARGQKRGNSGVYVAGVYEIQILDSYGLEGAENECGGVYKAARPRVNMCAPPLQWQTYDINYTAPRFDSAGKKTANARMTVHHNGVLIHENLELPGITPGGLSPNEPKGAAPIFLQDHGDKVQFRNIWAVKKEQ